MIEPITFLDGKVILYPGDCRIALKQLPDNSIDSVAVDPPYHLTSIVKRFGGENAKPVKSNLEHSTDKNLETIQAAAFKRLSKGFMGRTWDGGDIAFQSELWAEVLRVLKPGGYIVAFSGTRTYHRMACAIEDAGFITHPMLAWLFGSGFPKAHSVSKQLDKSAGAVGEIISNNPTYRDMQDTPSAYNLSRNQHIRAPATDAARQWDGWFYGTQSLKPALESIYMGQKPFSEKTGAANVLRWGTGALNIGATRIGDRVANYTASTGEVVSENVAMSGGNYGRVDTGETTIGRWPANLCHDGSEEVLACFPETGPASDAPRNNGAFKSVSKGHELPHITAGHSDNRGSAARFFASFPQDDEPSAKSRKKRHPRHMTTGAMSLETKYQIQEEENAALNGRDGEASANRRYENEGATNFAATPGRRLPPEPPHRLFYTAKADADDRLGSKHPTVKPLDLIQWLVRLITPPGGTTLDLFAGTGTTGEAAFREGFKAILIEREEEYQADIARRMSLVMDGKETRKHAGIKARGKTEGAGPLFDNEAAE